MIDIYHHYILTSIVRHVIKSLRNDMQVTIKTVINIVSMLRRLEFNVIDRA